ncbi:hypothetical protein V1478_011679 [Vespula squamosa]|uniref:Uncharacterized protein n=1 Tax=Vespula squamosa TaxID=30214 RepID=A0ABD2AHD5_VESSQ
MLHDNIETHRKERTTQFNLKDHKNFLQSSDLFNNSDVDNKTDQGNRKKGNVSELLKINKEIREIKKIYDIDAMLIEIT